MKITRYFEVYRVQIKNNFVREAVYRTNFLTALMVDAIWIGVELSLFSVLYANTKTLGGWTQNQMYFFLGVFFSADALFTIFFQRNFWTFSDLVNKGELDILLTKPIHPLFLALSRSINLTASFNLVLGLIIAKRYAVLAGFAGGWHWLELVLWLGIGLISALLIRFLFCVWVFWTDRSFAISRMYYQLFAFATKPDTIYPKMIRLALLTIIPFGFIGSVPTRAMLFGISGYEYLNVFGVLTGLFLLNALLWHRGLKRYQSASS